MRKKFSFYRRILFEPATWLAMLFFIFFMNVDEGAQSYCIFSFAELEHCPGCGIGRSMNAALHLDFPKSLHFHALGIPSALGIAWYTVKKSFQSYKILKHGSENAYDASGSSA